jgi:hypothetical protein
MFTPNDAEAGKYTEYNFETTGYQPIPKASKNGGHYTGEPFAKGAGYAPVQVKPDAFFMNSQTLKSAKPPPGALHQAAHTTRPGNNRQIVNDGFDTVNGILCTKPEKANDQICAYNAFDTFSKP